MYLGIAIILVSLVYSLLVSIVYFSKKRAKIQETKVYDSLVLINIVNLIMELLCCYTVYNIDKMPFLTEIINKLFLLTIFYWQTLFTVYVYIISFKKNYNDKLNFKKPIGKFAIVAWIIMVAGLIFLPLEYYNQNGLVYSYGKSATFLYGIVVIYFIAWIIFYIKKINKQKNKKYLPVLAFIFVMGIALVIRAVNPGILIISASFAFVTNLMFFTIENPDLKLLREIQESRELAEISNKEKAMFLYDTAQDIKLPIKDISNKCDELINMEDLNVIKEGLRNIKFSTKKLSSSVDGILDTSNIKHSNIEVAHNKYNIKNLLQEVSIKAKSDLKDKNIEFRSDFDVNIPEYLYGDSIRLKQILTIIIENAIKHTDKGFIEFNTSSIIKNDVCRLMINIEDSGKGISSSKLESLFYLSEEDLSDSEKLNKLTTTKENLSVIKLLTTLIGGTVIVNSTLGKGTKFTIVLDQEIHEDEKSSTIEAINTLKTMKRVLLVNNLDIDIKALSKILEKYDVSFDVVKWGQECLEKIRRKEKYDYILLDEEMPKLNGIKTFEKLKLESNFNIPVILLVEEHHAEHKDRYLNNGFIDVIAKPYKKVTVTKVLDKYLK